MPHITATISTRTPPGLYARDARHVTTPHDPGRAVGVLRATDGDILLFLHADCRLEPKSLATLRRFVADHPGVPGGCFRMRVEADDPPFRLIDAAAHLRAGLLGLPYGDQGLFATRRAFAR